MKRAVIATLGLMGLTALACGDTDVDGARQAMDTVPAVEPVDLDTVSWLLEGRSVEFDDRTWLVAGEPVIDPVVEKVGEFEGTPLYAELNTAEPYNALYIPLADDYWQMLEEGPTGVVDTVPASPMGADTVPTDTAG